MKVLGLSPRFSLIAVVVASTLALVPGVSAQEQANGPVHRRGDMVSVFGGDIHVPENMRLDGNVFSLGGKVVIEGRVHGDVVVVFGTLRATGIIDRGLVGVASGIDLEGAEIDRQLVNVAGTLSRVSTPVGGEVVNIGLGPGIPGISHAPGVLGYILFWLRLTKVLAAFVTILLLAALVPERIRVIADEAPVRYAAALFVGLLGYLGFLVVLALLSLTIIGIPIGILLFLGLKWLGMSGIFYAVGRRIGRSAGFEFSMLGSVLLGFGPLALMVLAPSVFGFIGLGISLLLATIVWIFIEVPAVGLVLLTRAGSPPRGTRMQPPVVPSAPPPDADPASGTPVAPLAPPDGPD